MKTKAVRIYGKKDLRLEEFELPEMKDDEILAQVISDSICMSSQMCIRDKGFVLFQKFSDSFNGNLRCPLFREAVDSGADIGKCNSFYSVIHRKTQ